MDLKIDEGGLSRMWQHTQNGSTFAIIGSQDKDTKEDRFNELMAIVNKLARKNGIGYKKVNGNYTYDDGTPGVEKSVIIYNIPKETALKIAKILNQESIVWKDKDFFGLLTADGEQDLKFTSKRKNMTFDPKATSEFSSQFKHGKETDRKPFNFTTDESLEEDTRPNTHQQHFEDLVWFGKAGLEELNDKIEMFMERLQGNNSRSNLTTKIDGAPAVICWSRFEGYPDNSCCLKTAFTAKEKKICSDYSDIERYYADRPEMEVMLQYCLEIAPHIPSGEAWQGDCLFTQSMLKEKEIDGTRYIIFTPNTLTYAISDDNPTYDTIRNADFGICFHTVYTGDLEQKKQSFNIDVEKLSDVPNNIYIMSPALDVSGMEFDTGALEQLYGQLKSAESKIINDSAYEDLIHDKSFMTYWSPFENKSIADNQQLKINKEKLVDGFLEYAVNKIKSKHQTPKTEQAKIDYITTLVDKNADLLYNIIDCLNLAVDIKMLMWNSLKGAKQNYKTFYNDTETGQYVPANMEGASFSDQDGNIVKISDRTEFAYRNRLNSTQGFRKSES